MEGSPPQPPHPDAASLGVQPSAVTLLASGSARLHRAFSSLVISPVEIRVWGADSRDPVCAEPGEHATAPVPHAQQVHAAVTSLCSEPDSVSAERVCEEILC